MSRISLRCPPAAFKVFLAVAVCTISLLSPYAAHSGITLPAGTPILVKMKTLLVTGQVSKGHRFTGFLEKSIFVGNQRVLTRGSRVYGEVFAAVEVGNISGRPAMGLQLDKVETAEGAVYIRTLSQGFVGTIEGTVNNMVTGKIVGPAGPGITVDSAGRVTIKPGALIEFSLLEDVEVN